MLRGGGYMYVFLLFVDELIWGWNEYIGRCNGVFI